MSAKVSNNKETGKMVETSHADDKKIIRLVKERKLLYARNNLPVASFYATVKRLWQEVAAEMNWTVTDVRRKWSHIRNSYSRHLRNEMHSVRTAKGRIVSRWYLADELDFLKNHMATDTRSPPIPVSLPQAELLDQGAESYPNMTPWFALPARTIHRPDSNEDSSTSFGPDENASFFQFFRGIYNDYQELPTKKQRLFKRQCLNFLHDLLDEEADPDNSDPEPNKSKTEPINMVRIKMPDGQMPDNNKIPTEPNNVNIEYNNLVIIKEERSDEVVQSDI